MNVFNVMNFVRACDERDPNYRETLFNVTKRELDLVNEFNIENTFLLQYDALCDERYVSLFKENATDKTELGLWLEIVEPLTSACGLHYKSQNGWKWDWHIIPGLPMGYIPEERVMLLREAMRKFKEIFGYYPKTIGGWLIDTFSVNFLSENYDIESFCICRDQVNTGAYTLIGGYFEGGYFPSKSNMFTPAQNVENQGKTPVFRLLGPCPVNNYDGEKFLPENMKGYGNVYSLEPVWGMGADSKCVDWFFKTYFENRNIGFHSLQLGQENSFTSPDFIPALRTQLEKAKEYVEGGKAQFFKYSQTGKLFKKIYDKTPVNSIAALTNWNGADTQSVYYNSRKYTANIFRHCNQIFIRGLYLFSDNNEDKYLFRKCTRFDAVYENLPVVDTVIWEKGNRENIGIVLDCNAEKYKTKMVGDSELCVYWSNKEVYFRENEIIIRNCGDISFNINGAVAEIEVFGNSLLYNYEGIKYTVTFDNARVTKDGSVIHIFGDEIAVKSEV